MPDLTGDEFFAGCEVTVTGRFVNQRLAPCPLEVRGVRRGMDPRAAAPVLAAAGYPMETPTPINPLGAMGVGESGTIGATPAVQSAVIDALAHLGVRHIDMPANGERVWQAIRDAAG